MKKLVLILLLIGCNPLKYIPQEESIYGIDLTRYTDKGFLITPEKYLGKYESIGLFEYTLVPAARS